MDLEIFKFYFTSFSRLPLVHLGTHSPDFHTVCYYYRNCKHLNINYSYMISVRVYTKKI